MLITIFSTGSFFDHSSLSILLSLIVSMHPQKPLCINAESWFDFANFGKQSTSNIDLSFFKNLNISVDKTKNPPLINFSIIFYFIFLTKHEPILLIYRS